MTLFLRWLLITSSATAGLVALALGGFASGLHGAPLVVTLVILTVASAASLTAGRLAWLADVLGVEVGSGSRLERRERAREARARLLHGMEHVFYAVAVLQVLGLVGAMLGYRQETASAALPDSGAAIHHLTLALGNGLTATLAGVACSLVVWLEHHVIAHELETV